MILDWDFMIKTFFLCLKGIPATLNLTIVTLIVSIPFAAFTAIIRMDDQKHRILRPILNVYVSFVRGTPFIVQIIILYYFLPKGLDAAIKLLHIPVDIYNVSNYLYAYLVLAFSSIAFLSEAFRSGLSAVGKGQYEAAAIAGLSPFRTYQRIIVPQAIVLLLPVLCTNVTGLIKMTSLAYAMAISEVTAIAKIQASASFNFIEAYLDITVIYIALCLIVEFIFKIIESRVKSHIASV